MNGEWRKSEWRMNELLDSLIRRFADSPIRRRMWHTYPMTSWQDVIRPPRVNVRLATPVDRAALAELLASTWRRHGVLAVEEQIALLSNALSVIAYVVKPRWAFWGFPRACPLWASRKTPSVIYRIVQMCPRAC